VVLGRDVIFTQYLSRVVRLLRFTQDYSGFEPFDLTIYAGHLFKHTVVRMDAQVIPHSIVWCVRDDGILLGLTYIPESEIFGWHQHDTEGGLFLDVCVVPEGEEHVVYALVQRTIDGDTVIYLERFDERLQYSDVNLEDAFFVDCGITYDGASTTTIDGLDHLEGEEVMALADGLTQGPFTVASGEIELTTAASVVQVGLPITAQLKTLPMDVGGTGLRDKRKRVQSLMALVEQSVAGWYAGPDAQHLLVVRREPYQTGTDLVDEGPLEINLTSRFDEAGQVLIEHTNPTPLSILGLIPQFTVGG
jgi:hypothetical protein